jgi:hypothetical protein
LEQVAPAAELSAKLARTIIRAMRNVLEVMVLPSSLFFCFVRLSSPELPFCPIRAAIVCSIPVRVNVKQFATLTRTFLSWIVVAKIPITLRIPRRRILSAIA